VVICLALGADLHMAQLMSLPLTISCSSKIQIGFTFLVPAHPGSPGQRAVKRVCVCVCELHQTVINDTCLLEQICAASSTYYNVQYSASQQPVAMTRSRQQTSWRMPVPRNAHA